MTSDHTALLNLLLPLPPFLPQHPLLQCILPTIFHPHHNASQAYALKVQLYIMDFKLFVLLSALKALHSYQDFMYPNIWQC